MTEKEDNRSKIIRVSHSQKKKKFSVNTKSQDSMTELRRHIGDTETTLKERKETKVFVNLNERVG